MNVFCSVLFILGAGFLYYGSFQMPSAASQNAVAKNKAFGLVGRLNRGLEKLSHLVLPYIKLTEQSKNRYEKMLATAGKQTDAGIFVAEMTVKLGLWVLLGLLLSFRSILITAICCGCGFMLYRSEQQKLRETYESYIEAVELDLPKLCNVINSRLTSTKNVQAILTSYLPIASPAMEEQIKLTLADMKTGNQQAALLRMEGRLSSAKVSDVVRGLVSVLNGDDQTVYFQSKQQQFNDDYLTLRKKEIGRRPSKLTLPNFAVFGFFLLIVLYSMLTVMGGTMKTVI